MTVFTTFKLKLYLWGTYLLLLAIAAHSAPALSSGAVGENVIVWPYPDFPPSHIISGPYKGQGIVNTVHETLFDYLDDYEHRMHTANFKRIIRMIESKRNVCGAALLKNDQRAQVVEYSVPHVLVHPVRIITRKDAISKFTPFKLADGTYDLTALLGSNQLMLGYSLGRSYSTEVDRILEKSANSKNSMIVAQNPLLLGLLKMLNRARIEFTLAYAHEAAYVAKTNGLEAEFISLPISGANQLIPVYVGCPKNDWGRNIIQRLNPMLLEMRRKRSFYSTYLQWLDPQAKAEYMDEVGRVFGVE